jgi:isoamylase
VADMTKSRVREGGAEAHGAFWDGKGTTEATLLILMNAFHDFVAFTLPVASGGGSWKWVLDTNVTEQTEGFERAAGDQYEVTARSLVMFALLSP